MLLAKSNLATHKFSVRNLSNGKVTSNMSAVDVDYLFTLSTETYEVWDDTLGFYMGKIGRR